MSRGTRSGQGLTTVPPWGAARVTAYTPATLTWAGNTVSLVNGWFLKTPGMVNLWVLFQETAGVASGLLTISLPSGLSNIASALPGLTCGTLARINSNTPFQMFASNGGSSVFTTATGAVDTWSISAQVPTTF